MKNDCFYCKKPLSEVYTTDRGDEKTCWKCMLMAYGEMDIFLEIAIDKLEFVECDSCRKKPGSPELCKACLWNRALIAYLRKQIFMGQ